MWRTSCGSDNENVGLERKESWIRTKIKGGIGITTVVQAMPVASLPFCGIMVNDPQAVIEWRSYQVDAASQCHAASLLCISGKVWAILS